MVVLDALVSFGEDADRISFLDEDVARQGVTILGRPVGRLDDHLDLAVHRFHVCVGNNRSRQRIHERLAALGCRPHVVVHPSSSVAISATIGVGVFVAAQAVVAPAARLQRGTIVNHGAVVDHECVVAEFCHVAPGVTLGGNVRLGTRVLVGAGATILPGVNVGDDAIVGAGAVVITDVPPQTTVVGVPARQIR
jgi:sugar O-acyltransferase (sialic acid O-acetyltransferase NeuD family)